MRVVIKKSIADYVQRRWGTPALRKSETRRQAFLRIKAALIRHCKQKMIEAKREEGRVKKAIADLVRLEKARRVYNIGETAIWGGKKYIKGPDKKWRRKYESGFKQTKGGAKAWQNILAKMDTINDERELMWFVQSHKTRFVDNAGLPLPEVEELSKLAHTRNDEIVARKDAEAKGKTEFVKPAPAKEKTKPVTGLDRIRQQYNSSRAIEGREGKIILSDGSKVAGRWRIVEADAPSASHDEETFNKTEGFPTNPDGSTINDRDYEHDRDAQTSVIDMAGEYDGRALKDPVVVSKDGVVISGNNRTMSGKLAAKNGTDGEYIEWLKDQCDMYKIDPSDLDDFKHPRLIFEIDTKEYSTKQFAAYNASDKKSQSPVEQAVKVAKTVKLKTVTSIARKIAEYETIGDLYANKSTMREIFNSLIEDGMIQQFDLPQYFAEDSGASDNGKEFLETVLIGSVVNAGNLRTLAAPGGKSIRQRLVRAIVPLVENKDMKGYSINDELNEAIRIACYVAQNKDKVRSVKDYGNQINLDGSRPDKLAVELAKKLESSSQKGFAEFMQEINAGLQSPASGQFDLVLGRTETRGEVLSRILNTTIDKSLRSLRAIRKSIARARRIARYLRG